MDALLQDLRYAVRTLAKSPGFAALTVVCLALGIGVNSTIFSVVDTVAIRPLPFRAPDELVAVHSTHQANGVQFGDLSYLAARDVKAGSRTFAELASVSERSLTLSDGTEPERFNGATVTWTLFPMLGVQPILGRQFRADEDVPGGARVVLLSHGVWQRRYGADRSIVGRSIVVNGTPYTVIGVMPPGVQFPERAQLWVAQTPLEHASPRSARNLLVFARLKRGASIDEARRDAAAIGDQLSKEQREDQGWGISVRSMRDELMPSDVRLIVLTMMGAVTLVLLIACANVANLLLARATVRHREIAVRAALGAGRGRIVRQLLTESVLIALASAPLGVAIAYIGLQWLTASIPPQNQVPYYIDWRMNPRVIVYTVVIATITGVVFGLVPALQAARANLQHALKDRGTGAGGSRNRLRSALVVAEIALSLVLLVGASLFIRSFLNLQDATTGLDTSPLMTMRFYMPGDDYETPDAMVRRVDDIVRRVETLPGVVAAAASNMVPMASGGSDGGVVPDGIAIQPGQEPHALYFGILCGMIGAFAVTRVVTSLLYNVSASDPFSFVITAAFLAVVATLASYVPARRATAVDPLVALRAE